MRNYIKQLKMMLNKRVPKGISHARVSKNARTGIAASLCGVLGEDSSFYSREGTGVPELRRFFSPFRWEVNCEFCLDHKDYEFWILNKTKLE